MNVVPLCLTDLDSCYELDRIALQGLWSKRQWEFEILDKKSICLGIFSNLNLHGLICGSLIIDELHLSAIAVHPEQRRRGVAKLLLSTLLFKAKGFGAVKVILEVSKSNLAAQYLYKSCGFKTSGYRHGYYKDGSDALMQYCYLSD